jgi:hypothetical protein
MNEFERSHEEEKRKLNEMFTLGVKPSVIPPVHQPLPKLPPVALPPITKAR